MRTTLDRALSIIEEEYILREDYSKTCELFDFQEEVGFEIKGKKGYGFLIKIVQMDREDFYYSIVDFNLEPYQLY